MTTDDIKRDIESGALTSPIIVFERMLKTMEPNFNPKDLWWMISKLSPIEVTDDQLREILSEAEAFSDKTLEGKSFNLSFETLGLMAYELLVRRSKRLMGEGG